MSFKSTPRSISFSRQLESVLASVSSVHQPVVPSQEDTVDTVREIVVKAFCYS